MEGYVAMLLRVFREYRLTDRYPQLAQYEMLAEMGRLSESMAKAILSQLEPIIDDLYDYPVHLHRPPTGEQLHANGKADIEFLTLQEGEEEVRYGIKLLDRPRFLVAAGATGSGKTTALRNIAIRVDELNAKEEVTQ